MMHRKPTRLRKQPRPVELAFVIKPIFAMRPGYGLPMARLDALEPEFQCLFHHQVCNIYSKTYTGKKD